MAQTRTAVGTPNSTKASGTSLSINNVTVPEGRSLIVGLCYDNSAGAPTSIKYGKRDLVELKRRANAGTGFTVALWRAAYLRHGTERNIVATWSSAILARAMFALYLDEAGLTDVDQSAEQDATTSPATGTAVTTTEANTIHIAAFMANGPDNDTAATANLGHTIGQRIGTAGVPPVSNITLQETYETLTATGDCRATLTLTTARDCAAVIVAFKARQQFTIEEVVQHHRDQNQRVDAVLTRCSDEAGTDFWLDPPLDPVVFDAMTDTEYKDYVKAACARYAHRNLDDGTNVDEDTARNTRMAGFVNDTVTL